VSYRGTRFSAATARWSGGKRPSNVTVPEGTRDDRRWHTELPGGMLREDIGAPVPRLPGEPQPVSAGDTNTARSIPQAPPLEPESEPAAAFNRNPNPKPFKPGLGRG